MYTARRMTLPRWPYVSFLLLLTTAPACKKKDPAKCDNAKSVIQKALASEEFALARQWRDYAYTHCADPNVLSATDKEITDKEAAAARRKADEEATEREAQQLVKLLSEWVTQHRADPTRAAVNVRCDGPEDSKERWCFRERSVGGKYAVKVRYWEETPVAHKFFSIAPAPIKCEAFGPAAVIAEKHGGAQHYCDITGGTLAGMKLLIQRATDGTHINLVSNEYLDKDPAFKQLAAP